MHLDATQHVLQEISLALLDEHPLNSNRMSPELLEKLRENIRRSRRCPPLLVRPFGERYQILNGAQRKHVLGDLGITTAPYVVWNLDDEEAALLLATVNRLRGQDVPMRRAVLLKELTSFLPLPDLARLLPEDEVAIQLAIESIDVDLDQLIEDFDREVDELLADRPVLFSFAVDAQDADTVKTALSIATGLMTGSNRQSRALVLLAQAFLERRR